MAKIPAPGHFEAKSEDPKDISVVLRATRNSRSVTQELMAQMLRVKTEELIAFESGADLPSDDVVLRLADVLSVPLDPLIAALEHTKEKDAKIRAAREAAEKETLEKQRLAREAKARFEEQERARSELAKSEKKPTMRTATEMPRRTLEDFGERLMDIAPVPVDPTRRKQWWTCARILFELDGA